MELIKDLGMREQPGGGVSRWGVYKCPECGELFERASATVEYSKRKGNGKICRACSNRQKAKDSAPSRTKTTEQFILDAIRIHGDKYSYTSVDYRNNRSKVTIICKKHGEFKQRPSRHLSGDGCPECAKERSNIAMRMSESNDRPTILYYIYFPEVNLWKIGCTSRTIEERFKQEKLEYQVLFTKEYSSGNEVYSAEKVLLDFTKEFKFTGKVLGVKGNSELRTQPVENLSYLIRKAESLYNSVEEDYIYH